MNYFKIKKNVDNITFRLIFDTLEDGFTSKKFYEKCSFRNNILLVIES